MLLAVNEQHIYHVRLAQLDRASGYGPEGREFESSIARKKDISVQGMSFYIYLVRFFLFTLSVQLSLFDSIVIV